MIATTFPGPWAVDDQRTDNCWGIVNTVTGKRKKIGPIRMRGVNFRDRARDEAATRNVEHFKLTTPVDVCLECSHAFSNPLVVQKEACVQGRKWLSSFGKYVFVYSNPGKPAHVPRACDCCQVESKGPRYLYRRVKWNPRSPK